MMIVYDNTDQSIQIVFNTNTSSKFTSKELNKLNTVAGRILS